MSSSNEGIALTAGRLSVMCRVLLVLGNVLLLLLLLGGDSVSFLRPPTPDKGGLDVGGWFRTSILEEGGTGAVANPKSCCMRLDLRSFPTPPRSVPRSSPVSSPESSTGLGAISGRLLEEEEEEEGEGV